LTLSLSSLSSLSAPLTYTHAHLSVCLPPRSLPLQAEEARVSGHDLAQGAKHLAQRLGMTDAQSHAQLQAALAALTGQSDYMPMGSVAGRSSVVAGKARCGVTNEKQEPCVSGRYVDRGRFNPQQIPFFYHVNRRPVHTYGGRQRAQDP